MLVVIYMKDTNSFAFRNKTAAPSSGFLFHAIDSIPPEASMTRRKLNILTRHNAASPNEFIYYARSLPMRQLCRTLGRHERTIKDWMNGKSVIPPWAVAVLRLQALEYEFMRDQMGFTAIEREAASPSFQTLPRARRPAANEPKYAPQFTLDVEISASPLTDRAGANL
jgi:hypothetical protein